MDTQTKRVVLAAVRNHFRYGQVKANVQAAAKRRADPKEMTLLCYMNIPKAPAAPFPIVVFTDYGSHWGGCYTDADGQIIRRRFLKGTCQTP